MKVDILYLVGFHIKESSRKVCSMGKVPCIYREERDMLGGSGRGRFGGRGYSIGRLGRFKKGFGVRREEWQLFDIYFLVFGVYYL